MRTVRAEVPRQPDHEPLALVDWDGYQWLVVEVDTANGITVLERALPDDMLPTGATEGTRVHRWGWPPVIVAICAVFLFLALVASMGERLTFMDVVGAIVGFVVLIVLLDRREDTRPPARPIRWWWL